MTEPKSPRTAPRRLELKAIVLAPLALGLILVVVLPVVFTYNSFRQYRTDSALSARGAAAVASFEALALPFRAGQPLAKIRYTFRSDDESGGTSLEGSAWVTAAFYATLSSQPKFAVRYDTANPEVSTPVYDGMEQARPPDLETMSVWSAVTDLGLAALFFGLPLRVARRDLRLLRWGIAARAKITSVATETGRAGDHLLLDYEFVDRAGHTIVGQRVLWAALNDEGRPADPRIRAAMRDPVVLYDPDDSRRHLLYPSGVADIRR